MDRQEIYRKIESRLGFVPEWVRSMPDQSISELSGLLELRFRETSIPPKYRDLIALAAATSMRSRTGIPLNREVAKMHGATDEEVHDAVLLASMVTLLGTYLDGIQYATEPFKKEVDKMVSYGREGGGRLAEKEPVSAGARR